MKTRKEFSDYRFLIIGGTSKSATTSLFSYLAGHPEICPSRAKETRYFLDPDYPLASKLRHDGDRGNGYLTFFEPKVACQQWCFEATPDYLHSPGTPERLRQTLPHVALIFVLREPIARLLSWYRFGMAMDVLPKSLGLEDYVQLQLENEEQGNNSLPHPAYSALRTGRYSEALRPYFELFGRESIYVGFFEDLSENVQAFMEGICRFASIDGDYFQEFSFGIQNKGVRVRTPGFHRAWIDGQQKFRGFVRNHPRARSVFRRAGGVAERVYRKINVLPNQKVSLSEDSRKLLQSYYEDDVDSLQGLIRREVPWSHSAK